jgi:DNA-directed RNA polymerase specialized sigma24 family protein
MDIMHTDVPQNILLWYLSKLDDLTRECIYARYVLGYDYHEIATLHSISQDNARQKISRGIKELRVYADELV